MSFCEQHVFTYIVLFLYSAIVIDVSSHLIPVLAFMRSRHLRLMAYTVRPYATSRRQHLLHNCSTQVQHGPGSLKRMKKRSMQSILNKTVRYGFLTNYKPLEYLFESSYTTLFSAMYCIRYFLHLKRQGIIYVSAAMTYKIISGSV